MRDDKRNVGREVVSNQNIDVGGLAIPTILDRCDMLSNLSRCKTR